MAKLSKMVNRRHKAAKCLRSAVRTHGHRPAKALEERMAAVLEDGEQVPDVMHFIDVLSRLLESEVDKLETTDDDRSAGNAAAQSVRKGYRNPAADELRRMIVDLRKSLNGIYGTKETNDILGIKGRTPRGYEDLLYFGKLLVIRLPAVQLPEPKVDMGIYPETWAAKLKPLVERLDAQLEAVDSRNWDEGMAVDARNQQIGEFDRDYVPVTRLIECVYVLGGDARLTRYLRPWLGRRLVNRSAAMAAGSSRGSWVARLEGFLGRGLLARVVGRWW